MKLLLRAALISALFTTSISEAINTTTAEVNRIEHVIVITLDNVHWSDILQMPHLTAFLRRGTVFDNDHTVLTSYTQPDMVSFLSGAYPDRTGILHNHLVDRGYPISDWRYWENRSYVHFGSQPESADEDQDFIPVQSPWRQFNDHGWDVGVVRAADMALESAAEVHQYRVMNDSDHLPSHYLKYAIHCTPGSVNCAGVSRDARSNTIFGSPNIPWLFDAPLLDGSGTVGPYRDHSLTAMLSLSATYAMQAHGIPVTYSYIIAAQHQFDLNSPPYIRQLHEYDHAFDLFLTRLASIGVSSANTLFVLTADEGDHFCPHGLTAHDLPAQLPALKQNALSLRVIGGTAALVYGIHSAQSSLRLGLARTPPGWLYIAGPIALEASHASASVNSPLRHRRPSFVIFGDVETWWNGTEATSDRDEQSASQVKWTHGTISPEINRTWLGLVGPGIRAQELSTFIDHVDALPTIDYLLGHPIPSHLDGRVLFEAIATSQLPATVSRHLGTLHHLADAFKQLNAPLGGFARAAIVASTRDILRATAQQTRADTARWRELVAQRNALAPRLQGLINAAVYGAPWRHTEAAHLLHKTENLLDEALEKR